MTETFTPPEAAQRNAQRVLDWRREHGDDVQGMTRVGWARAHQLASGRPVSLETVRRMAQFARHRQNAAVAPEYADEPWRDAGNVAWLGWGGDAGIEWARRISSREKATNGAPNYHHTIGLQKCGTCDAYTSMGRCKRYDFQASSNYTCDAWRPDIPALQQERKAVAAAPTAIYAHGPGGLFSQPGLGVGGQKRGMRQTKAEKPTKTEPDGKHPAGHYLVVEDEEKPSTWHLPVYDTNGKLDRRRMGAAGAALTVGYRGNKYEGPGKKEALVKLRRLYRQIGAEPPGTTTKAKFDKASTQLDMPAELRDTVLAFAATIPETELSADGIERDTHVTVFYGLAPNTLDLVRWFASLAEPIKLRFGGTSLFARDDFDVLKIDVESPQLRLLHEMLARLPNANTREDYHPHLTIAYLRPGMGYQYVGSGPLAGTEVVIDHLTFSDAGGEKTIILLGKPQPAEKSTFMVFKDHAGKYRWVGLSSNAYRDRDGEIISTKALRADVARADGDGSYGPLRFWHMPGVDLGVGDFNMLHGRVLIESGTFADARIGQLVAQKAQDYQLSIGFFHPPDEPDRDGVYHTIRRFERSLVPAGRAANPFTSLSVKEKGNDMNEKIKALTALLEDDSLVQQVLRQADGVQKQADSMGVAFKTAGKMTADELLELALALKEAELANAEKAAAGREADGAETAMDYAAKMDGLVTRLDECVGRMEKMMSARTKDAGAVADTVASVAEAADAHTKRIGGLEQTVKELQAQLAQAAQDLVALKAEQPAGIAGSVRPTAQTTNVAKGEAQKEVGGSNGAYADFLKFVGGPQFLDNAGN